MGADFDVTDIPHGTVLMDKYRVAGTIGVGGMGVVISADHLQLDCKVAIKFMLPSLAANEAVVKRFVNEARAATRIHSEHVARVLDVGSMVGPDMPAGGLPYMVMEYLRGRDLSHYIRSGVVFSAADAIDYVAQACEALAHAHRVGIIHRDIKPANLFLAEYEAQKVVKVLDFGISKVLDEHEAQELSLTKTTTVLGSGLYMSPEQMRSAKNVDFRTDIYSLGVCLYELLSGTQPFTAETFSELCLKVNMDPPTPLRQYRPDISEELAAAIAKAYARAVEDRYQSVQAFVAALGPFAAPVSASTIQHVQGITIAHERRSSIPPPAVVAAAPGARAPALAATAGALTASREPQANRRPTSLFVAAAALALAAAGLAGVIVLRGSDHGASPATSAATTTSAAIPASSATTTAAAETSTSNPTASATPSGSASAAPSLSGSARPAGSSQSLAPRPAHGSARVVAPPPKLTCFKEDPVTHLKVPCL